MTELKMDIAALDAFMAREFPQAGAHPMGIEALEYGKLTLRHGYHADQLRPGGTLSGPTMMAVADRATYLVILAAIGPVALAVTTNLNINFLSKPAQRDLIAHARILKLGKRLAVTQVAIHSEGHEPMVAHATVTYSIPPR